MKNKIRDISIIVLLVTLFCFIFMFLARLPWYSIAPLYLSLIFVSFVSYLNFNRRQKIVLVIVPAACLLALQYYIDNYTVEGKYKHRLEKCKIFTETLQEKIKKNKYFKNVQVVLQNDRKIEIYIVGEVENNAKFDELKQTVNFFLPFPVPVYIVLESSHTGDSFVYSYDKQ